MEQKINIAELLKDAPEGTKLYTPIFGEVTYIDIDTTQNDNIKVRLINDNMETFIRDGRYTIFGECMLFPSKDNRSWENFSAPWLKDYKSCMNCKFARKLKEHIACDEHPDRVDHAVVFKNEEAKFYHCENYQKEETRKRFEPFQKVLILVEGVWKADFYSHRSKDDDIRACHYVVSDIDGFVDNKILPYEGNEDKLGKEVEEK